jgi:hypothetical protein
MNAPWPEYEAAAAAARTTRRRFLLAAGAGLAAVVTGIGLTATPLLRQGPYPPRPDGLEVLDDLHHHVLMTVAALLLPAGVDPAPTLGRLDTTLAALEPGMRRGFLAVPTLLEGSGFVLGGRLLPFTELSIEQQQRVLDRWSASPLLISRQAVVSMRQLILMHHYGAGPS